MIVNQSFNATSNGDYSVIISQNGCIDTSECTSVTYVNILESTFRKDIKVYSNPTNGLIIIDLGSNIKNTNASISDINGKIIGQYSFNNNQTIEMNISERPGIYILSITPGNKRATISIVKN